MTSGVLVAGGSRSPAAACARSFPPTPGSSSLGEARTRADLLSQAAQLRPAAVVLDPDLPQRRPAGAGGADGVPPGAGRGLRRRASDRTGNPGGAARSGSGRRRHPRAAAHPLRATRPGRTCGSCLLLASRIRVIRHPRGRLTRRPPVPHTEVPLVIVGASTGGPSALGALLSSLPRGLAAAVVVVQHMPAGFVSGLAGWLDTCCPMPVHLGKDGDLLRPVEVMICPGDVDSRDRSGRPARRRPAALRPPLLGCPPRAFRRPRLLQRGLRHRAAGDRGPADRDGTRRRHRHGGAACCGGSHGRPGREHLSHLRDATRRHRRRSRRPHPSAAGDRRGARGSRQRRRRGRKASQRTQRTPK